MHPFRLTIAKPCLQEWDSMQGSDKRRHCASCDNEVVALAEMRPEDALTLVRNAKPHSLCLRIEHDDNGQVLFRKNAAQPSSMPLLVLTMGASLLVNACDKPASTEPEQRIAQTPSAQSVVPAAMDSAPHIEAPSLPETFLAVGAKAASSAEARPATSVSDRPVKLLQKPTTRVTTGCVCAVGDTLCDCL